MLFPDFAARQKTLSFLVFAKSWWEFSSIVKQGGGPGGRKGIIKDKKWNIKIEGNPLLSWNSVSHPVSFLVSYSSLSLPSVFSVFSQGHRSWQRLLLPTKARVTPSSLLQQEERWRIRETNYTFSSYTLSVGDLSGRGEERIIQDPQEKRSGDTHFEANQRKKHWKRTERLSFERKVCNPLATEGVSCSPV